MTDHPTVTVNSKRLLIKKFIMVTFIFTDSLFPFNPPPLFFLSHILFSVSCFHDLLFPLFPLSSKLNYPYSFQLSSSMAPLVCLLTEREKEKGSAGTTISSHEGVCCYRDSFDAVGMGGSDCGFDGHSSKLISLLRTKPFRQGVEKEKTDGREQKRHKILRSSRDLAMQHSKVSAAQTLVKTHHCACFSG